jgi:hypothetical protein
MVFSQFNPKMVSRESAKRNKTTVKATERVAQLPITISKVNRKYGIFLWMPPHRTRHSGHLRWRLSALWQQDDPAWHPY